MFEKKVLNIYAVIIGAFFIISGLGKAFETTAFANLISQYGLGYLMLLAPVIVILEIFVGINLILLIHPRFYALFASILLIVFTASFAYAHFKHGINDCGCFGTLIKTEISPIYSFLRNFILLLMSVLVFLKYPKEKTTTVKWKKQVLQAVMYPSIFISGLSFTMPSILMNNTDTIVENSLQNKMIKNTAFANYLTLSSDSTYLVFCFSYTCPHCWNSIENLRQYKVNSVDSVIAFATGSDSSKQYFLTKFHPDFTIKDLPLDEMTKLTSKFPTSFYIVHDSIKAVIEGELPSHVIFENQYINSSKPK